MKFFRLLIIIIGSSIFQYNNAYAIQFSSATIEESIRIAHESNKLVLAYFYSTSCSHCVYMEKNVFPDIELTKLVDDSFIAAKSNPGNNIGRMEYYEYRISAHPTLLVFNSKGEELLRIKGRTEKNELIVMLTEVVGNKDKGLKNAPVFEEGKKELPEPDEEHMNIRQSNVTRQKY